MKNTEHVITEHLDLWSSAITAKNTTGRGSNKKIELYGVKKLRELILELASEGRLVKRTSSAQCKKSLSDVVELVMGQAPPGSECNKNGIGTIFVKTGEFGDLYPKVEEWTTKPLKLARRGDVLICVVGATIGKLNLAIDCAIGRSVAAIRPSSIINTEFLYYSLMPFTMRVREKSKGSAQGVIGKSVLNAVVIRVPDIEEQIAIVNEVGRLMALCDQLETQTEQSLDAHATLADTLLDALTQAQSHTELMENWARLEQNWDILFPSTIAGIRAIDKLKQTILQLAVMGKLVKRDPADEPASELLKRIAAEKEQLVKEKKIKKQKPLPLISEEEKPFELPEGWEWTRLGDFAYVFSGNSFKSQDFNEQSGVRVIKITNAGVGKLIETEDFLPSEFSTEYPNYVVRRDDLILALTRPYISTGLKVSSCPASYDGALLNQRVAAIRAFTETEFLYSYMQSDFVLGLYQRRFGGSGLQPNLKVGDVTDLVIPVPPLEEQKRIVAKVEKLTTLCDQLKQRLQTAQQTQQHFTDAVVAGALA
ncbi:restriction endonuclease subunit S [Aestuariicella sp. G3-2]|uniref:restriction endonuclease subunit S n=1 Tax=Pseudomaricurvus albidus TaxID=2842452 RepID=UPI001C0C4277|nr:restriction endonuclease subunit S [Aestuariicella albida]MBU3070437.1 restriction endonuclease subunit S [Aestuariicella albida]